jgi:prepilin-type N-terminal cleavage/methylation domain-containing protein
MGVAEPTSGRVRSGFTLLEVIIALAIMVTAMTVLVETQGNAAQMTLMAQRVVLATDLASYKLNGVLLLMEEEGFGDMDLYEAGDFDDLGDDVLNTTFDDALDDYEWEWWVSQIDIGLAGDIAAMTDELEESGLFKGGSGDSSMQGQEMPSGAPTELPDLGMFGLSPELMTERLAPFVREVRVRVWWGEDSEEAEKRHDEVYLTTHIVNPTGQIIPGGAVPTEGGQAL